MSYSDLVIIPINPDFFASKGLNLLLKSIKLRIEPFPVPRIGVLMNKARPTTSPRRKYSIETERYWDDAQRIAEIVSKKEGIKVKCFEAFIPERQSIKREIQQGMPPEFHSHFNQLLKEVEEFINEPS